MAIISSGTTIASGGSLSVSANPPSTFNGVGTYGLLRPSSLPNTLAGGVTVAMSSTYFFSNCAGNGSAGYASGTWRLMSDARPGGNPNVTGLWIRIS